MGDINLKANLPLISIVTPSYNQGQYIEETICSILNQNYPNLEYIVIDGGSSDNTIDIIKKYEANITFWTSKKDAGQANAINKGLTYCTGEIFNWLNSDDYLEPGALFKIAEAFADKNVDVVAGKVNNFSIKENEIVANKSLSALGLMCWEPDVHFIQPGVWLRRQHVMNCNGLNENFHYAFDWDLLIRYLYAHHNIRYLDEVLVNFRLHQQSKTMSSLQKFSEEEKTIIKIILTDARYTKLHDACRWKIKRTEWTQLLDNAINDIHNSKFSRVKEIATNLFHQPADIKTWRMTAGALVKIIF